MIFFRFFSIKFNNRLTVIKKLLYLHHNNCTRLLKRLYSRTVLFMQQRPDKMSGGMLVCNYLY